MTESIEYNNKIYTIKDIPESFFKIEPNCQDPLKRFIGKKMAMSRYYIKNKETLDKKNHKNYITNKDHYQKRAIERYYEKREEHLKTKSEYYHANKDIILKRDQIYRSNPDVKKRRSEYAKIWGKNNVDKVNENHRKAYHNSRKHDEKFVIRQRLHQRLRGSFLHHGQNKSKPADEYNINYSQICNKLELDANKYGYTLLEMTQLGYHVDHIIPINSYDYTSNKDIKNSFSLENHRWLPAKENISKGSRLRPEDIKIIKTLPKEIYPISWKGKIPKEAHATR